MLTLTYEFKLIPSQEQVAMIENILAVCRKVWNYALRERKDWYNSRKCSINSCSLISEYIIPADAPYPNYNVQAANLTQAKKSNPELKSVNAQVLQQVRLSRPIPEGFKLKQVRIVRRASGYFAMLSLQSPVNVPDTPASGYPLGIDVGLDKFLATSDGELIERPRFLSELHSKLKLTSDPAPSHGARERASCYNVD